MTIRGALREATRELEACGVPDARIDAGWLLSEVTGVPRLALDLEGRQLSLEEEARFGRMVERRREREAVQYIIGYVDFCGARVSVDLRALIPRPETELLFERCADYVTARVEALCGGRAYILDLCTGSGALAVALAKRFPDAAVAAADISADALSLARENAARNGAAVEFFQGDLFDPLARGVRFDVIVCNPPYIPAGEIEGLQYEVRREPRLALDGGADGLEIIRRVASRSGMYLKDEGTLFVEIGAGQAAAVRSVFCEYFEYIAIHNDLSGILRIVEASWPIGGQR